jgi:cell fate regulator YaaT (PSP1 superfamily)
VVTIVGIRFKRAGKIYYFAPGSFDLQKGDHAIVETARGVEYGEVVMGPQEVDEKSIVSPLKSVIRKADERDARKVEENHRKEKEAFTICEKKIAARKLEMRLVNVEYTFDGGSSSTLQPMGALISAILSRIWPLFSGRASSCAKLVCAMKQRC